MKPVREFLAELANGGDAALARHSYGGLSEKQISGLAKKDIPTYTGKVRDVVRVGDELLIVHSDRLTAFDKLIGMVPYKGTILTAISDFWLKEAKKVVPTHLISQPNERVLRCEVAVPFKIEVIVRGYLAGSMMRAYDDGDREFCGEKLPEGLTPYGILPRSIITPTTKAAAFEHDENTTPQALIKAGVCSKAEWDQISSMALTLFAHGQKVSQQKGWLLVDTKYEFGRTLDGKVKVIDEIHTPDSSRFWISDTYEKKLSAAQAPDMLDKETVRRYLIEQGFKGHGAVPKVPVDRLIALAEVYLQVAEKLSGKPVLTAGPGQTIDIESL